MIRILKLVVMAALVLVFSTAANAEEANIPAGTQLNVRIIEKISSETASVGDVFHGTLATPVAANGRTLFYKGADVTGEVVRVERSGRLSRPGELELSLRTIVARGRAFSVSAQPFLFKGDSHAKSNVTKIGGGTALGAVIGALAGGGKGAAIGAGAGAAAGTGVAAATGKQPAELPSEAVLTFAANPPANQRSALQEPDQPSGNRYSDDDSRRSHGHRVRRSDGDDENEDDYKDRERGREDYEPAGYDGRGPAEFSLRDRRILRDCFVDDRSGLPPGLAKKDRLPPGLERHLQRNGTLPPGLQKRVQPLPGVCSARLSRLPRDWSRVVLSRQIILLDPAQRIVDLFWPRRD